MTEKERKLALHCLKANSDYHSEICEECIKYPCSHRIQDDVTETIIKELEQESKTAQPSEDCISRQAVDDAIYDYSRSCDVNYQQIMEFIDKIPPANPQEPKTEERTEMHECDCISREAAIDYCRQLVNVEHQQGSDEMNYGQERVNQTETILHHLEIMPSVQPSKDCISRKLMHDMGATCIAARNKDGDLVALGALDVLPSATPQPKTEGTRDEKVGHWEWTQYDSKPNFGNWHCSECRHILRGAIKGNPVKLPNYCEDCGSYNGGTK